MDMGFSRDHATEALLVCGNNLTAAMEWILTHPQTEDTATSSGDAVRYVGSNGTVNLMCCIAAASVNIRSRRRANDEGHCSIT